MPLFHLTITGTVQGVGFRPHIYRLATAIGLTGNVGNDDHGVWVTIEGTERQCRKFFRQLNHNLPPLAELQSISTLPVDVHEGDQRRYQNFSIQESAPPKTPTIVIPPDISICPVCEQELFDPTDRRYRHPFISCTNCGPRYTLIKRLPYDRASTSMAAFPMCRSCRQEYEDPADRRYHAQPISCLECGPDLFLYDNTPRLLKKGQASIPQIVAAIKQGKIVAVKGIGGYHLICDAANDQVISTLRRRKNRPAKPLAVMVPDIHAARKLVNLDLRQEEVLLSPQRPILLARKKENTLSRQVAPQTPDLGVFLPYTPLLYLLLRQLQSPVVATSANISSEPLATSFDEVVRVKGVWDLCLDHNRDILNGCDDSVVAVVAGERLTCRRARGYAPGAIELPQRLPQKVLAVGANQKNCVAVAFNNTAILSPHIGDLHSIESVDYFSRSIASLFKIYNFKPDIILCDKHRGYESSKWARQYHKENKEAELISVQHHHAHILAVMIEKKLIGQEVLGVAFDGTGLGDDGTLWGGEFLLASPQGYRRVAHFKKFKLLGGEPAITEPRRVALSLLFDLYGEEALSQRNRVVAAFTESELKSLLTAYRKDLNSPQTSSCGRIFDAVGSIIGLCQKVSYEGECGLRMEALYDHQVSGHYPFAIGRDGSIDFLPMIQEMLHEPEPARTVSMFFNTLVEIIDTIHQRYRHHPVVLCGGVFQNKVLVRLISARITNTFVPAEIPPNDGGIALGQIGALLAG